MCCVWLYRFHCEIGSVFDVSNIADCGPAHKLSSDKDLPGEWLHLANTCQLGQARSVVFADCLQ